MLLIFLAAVGVTAGEARAADVFKVGISVRPALRELEFRQVIDPELEVHVARFRDLGRVFQSLRPVGKEGGHFVLGLEIEFLGLKPHPGGVVYRSAHLNTHEHVLDPRVLAGEVVGVVGGDEGDACLFVDLKEAPDHLPLLGDAVVLQL